MSFFYHEIWHTNTQRWKYLKHFLWVLLKSEAAQSQIWGFQIHQCGSNKIKLVLLGNYKIEKLYLPYMPVCNFFWDSGDRVQGGTWHCHESCLYSYHTCPGSRRHRHLLVFEGSWENLERVKQHRSDDVWCTKRGGVIRGSIYSTKWDLI